MNSPTPVTNFYRAMADQDLDALRAVVHPDFVGYVTDSLPEIGGVHRGRDAMVDHVWIPAYLTYCHTPDVDEIVVVDERRAIVFGAYRAGADSGAAFVHDIRHDGHQLVELHQTTDTLAWLERRDHVDRQGR